MGLALEVGILADLLHNDEEGYDYFKRQFEILNRYLRETNLPEHKEPDDCEVWDCQMFGYSGLHYVRRLAAHLDATGELPSPGDDEAANDVSIQRYFEQVAGVKGSFILKIFKRERIKRTFDHLIVHSDAEGFYLPIEFTSVIVPPEELEIVGGWVGSSYRLLSECQRIAEALQIPPELDETSEELWNAADSQGEGDEIWQRYGVESFSCVALIRGCMKSIETKAALVFA
jgi:hypothetical protein